MKPDRRVNPWDVHRAIFALREREWPPTKLTFPTVATVLLAIITYADNDSGELNPETETMASKAGVSRCTVSKVLSLLYELGVLKQIKRGGLGRGSSKYVLSPEFIVYSNVNHVDATTTTNTENVAENESNVNHVDATPSNVNHVYTQCKPRLHSNVNHVYTNYTGTNYTPLTNPHTPKGDSEKDSSLSDDSPPVENSDNVLEKPSKKPSKRKSKALSLAPYSDDFLRFWSAYPRKTGKGKAWEKYQIAAENDVLPPIDELVSIVERHAETDQWTKDNGQFIPHPATWLYQRCWEDEVDAKPKIVKPHYTKDY